MGTPLGYAMTPVTPVTPPVVLGVEQLDELESLAGDIRFRMSEAASREMLNLVNAYRYLAERFAVRDEVWLVEASGSDDEEWVASAHATQASADARAVELRELVNDRPYPFYSSTGDPFELRSRATEWLARARAMDPWLEWAEDVEFRVTPMPVRP